MKKSIKKMRLSRMEALLLISVVTLLATMIVGGLWLVNDSSQASVGGNSNEFTKSLTRMITANVRNSDKDNYKTEPVNTIEIDCYKPDTVEPMRTDGKLQVECLVRASSNEPVKVAYSFLLDGVAVPTTDLTNNVIAEMETGFQIYSLRFLTNSTVSVGKHTGELKVTAAGNTVSDTFKFMIEK